MAALPALRPVACVAALNAAAQGLVGVVLSVLALCVCFCAIGFTPQAQDNDLGQYITYYFQGEECGDHDYRLLRGVTGALVLRIWVAISLLFSASMLVSSLILLIAVAKQWSDEKLQIALVSWLFINSFTAVDDVVLGYVFGNDFLMDLDSSNQEGHVGPFTLAIITFLSVRGVYLWLLNLAFIAYLFRGARALHKYLNEQIPAQDQQPIESWPTLDDFGKSKIVEIEQTPTAVNPRVAERMDNVQPTGYPEYSAMARWPKVNGQAQTLREMRPGRGAEVSRDRKSKTVRGHSFRQGGVDNPAYEGESRYYLSLQNETGSTRDYEEYQTDKRDRDRRPQSRQRERSRSQPPRSQQRSQREISSDYNFGIYKQTTQAQDPWREKSVPQSSTEYLEEEGVTIPPVDYLDLQPEGEAPSTSTSRNYRPQSLQEAILDRTLRLKKVPEELKKGLQK